MKLKAEARFGCNRRIIFSKVFRQRFAFNFEDSYSVRPLRIENRSDHHHLLVPTN